MEGSLMAVLTVNNICKRYGGIGGSADVLKNVSFTIEPGRIVGLLGPNGSGKTTLIKIITGLIKDFTGDISVNGLPIGHESKALVSYLPDREYLPVWMQVKNAVVVGVNAIDTIKICDENGKILSTPKRDTVFCAQTPQAFYFPTIFKVHQALVTENFTDDASMMEFLGHEVFVIEGSYKNKKITVPEDLCQ
jgi:ABC-type nitrate/sulfonate/bicarbonate transport system ATPase subunit